MKIEVGKRYVRRDGRITGTLVRAQHDNPEDQERYPFEDPDSQLTYTADGVWVIERGETHLDLVREYGT